MSRPSGINPRQRLFIAEYLVDLNAAAAMRRAGYTTKNPDVDGQVLLRRPLIQRAVAEALEARAKRTQVTSDKVVQELARLGFSDIRKLFDKNGDLLPTKDIDDDTAAAISSIEVDVSFDREGNETGRVKKIRLWPKGHALELIGKHLSMFEERFRVNGTLELIVKRKIVDRDESS